MVSTVFGSIILASAVMVKLNILISSPLSSSKGGGREVRINCPAKITSSRIDLPERTEIQDKDIISHRGVAQSPSQFDSLPVPD